MGEKLQLFHQFHPGCDTSYILKVRKLPAAQMMQAISQVADGFGRAVTFSRTIASVKVLRTREDSSPGDEICGRASLAVSYPRAHGLLLI